MSHHRRTKQFHNFESKMLGRIVGNRLSDALKDSRKDKGHPGKTRFCESWLRHRVDSVCFNELRERRKPKSGSKVAVSFILEYIAIDGNAEFVGILNMAVLMLSRSHQGTIWPIGASTNVRR